MKREIDKARTLHEENMSKHEERRTPVFMWRKLPSINGDYWRRVGPFANYENDISNRKDRGFKTWDELTADEKKLVNLDKDGKKVFEV